MYKLIRFFNQNRKKIIEIILIIVLILGIIQIFNYMSENKTDDNILIENKNANYNIYSDEVISDKSAISGETISSSKLKNDTDLINKFVEYCNEGNVEAAYGLLSDECKDEMFPIIEDFNNIYYLKIFGNGEKSYTIENWSGNIYQVRFTEDILSTGKLNSNDTKQDYITIVKNNDENKLNINNYIGRNNLNKSTEYEDVKITVKSIDTYMDYEVYNLSIENNADNDILLDTSDDVKSVYLLDSKNMKYYFYNNEIVENRLLVESKFINNLQIKFSNSYSSSRSLKRLVFSKLVLNYDEYKNLENKEEYKFYKFEVNI